MDKEFLVGKSNKLNDVIEFMTIDFSETALKSVLHKLVSVISNSSRQLFIFFITQYFQGVFTGLSFLNSGDHFSLRNSIIQGALIIDDNLSNRGNPVLSSDAHQVKSGLKV